MVKTCKHCGWENQENAAFCSSCGKSLSKQEEDNKEEKYMGFDYKKLIILSYIVSIAFTWGGVIFNILVNRHGVGFFGFIGLFLPFYLVQSNNPTVKKHGYIQIIISLIGILISTMLIFNIF